MASRNPVNSPVEVGSFIVLLYPIIFKVLDMPGAGFLPSTVCLCQHNQQKQSGRPKNLRLRKFEERFCTYDSNVSREKLEKNHTTNAGTFPIVSMYGIFSYIYHKNQPNVGKYTIRGSYGFSNHQGGFVLEKSTITSCFTTLDLFTLGSRGRPRQFPCQGGSSPVMSNLRRSI